MRRMRRFVFGVLVVLLAAAFTQTASAAVHRALVGNFAAPVQVDAPPWVRGSTIYVVEKGGRIVRLASGTRTVVLDIHTRVSSGDEQGLLSVAFHPQKRVMWVYYTNTAGNSRVVRFRLNSGGGHVIPGSGTVILRAHQPFSNHNGGTLRYHAGHLYMSLGDGGLACDPAERAQNPSTKLGKLLRRDGGSWTKVAYGLRNPWRWSFDRRNGDLYIGDVGQSDREEIDVVPASKVALPRENFGWDKWEGSRKDTCENRGLRGSGTLTFPRFEYDHSIGNTVIGGFVYRGSNMSAQRGRYFFGDLSGWLRSADARTLRNRHVLGFQVSTLVSFGESSKGELFAVSLDGPVYRLVDH
jgi:glucose/arabinose dehydrogenase